MTESEWIAMCGLIVDLWPHFRLNPGTAQEWGDCLRNHPVTVVEHGIRKAAMENQWPSLSAIASGTDSVTAALRPPQCPTCGETDHYTPTDQETQCPNYHIIETLNGRPTR